MTEPIPTGLTPAPAPVAKKSFLSSVKDAAATWAASPSGKHVLVALAAGLGTLLEHVISHHA